MGRWRNKSVDNSEPEPSIYQLEHEIPAVDLRRDRVGDLTESALESDPVWSAGWWDDEGVTRELVERHIAALCERMFMRYSEGLWDGEQPLCRQRPCAIGSRCCAGDTHMGSPLEHSTHRALGVSERQTHRMPSVAQRLREHIASHGLTCAQDHREWVCLSSEIGEEACCLLFQCPREGTHHDAVGSEAQRASLADIERHA